MTYYTPPDVADYAAGTGAYLRHVTDRIIGNPPYEVHMDATLLAHADVSRLLPCYDSHTEAWYAEIGYLLTGDELGSQVALTQYHAVTLHLPGGSYTPDFLHVLADGRLVIVEVKGSQKQKGYRDARSKLRAAADLYRWATWLEIRADGKGACELELIEA